MLASIDQAEWTRLIRAEYTEIPGLSLTRKHAQRLWNLDPDTCNELAGAMVAKNFLRRTPGDRSVRAESGR